MKKVLLAMVLAAATASSILANDGVVVWNYDGVVVWNAVVSALDGVVVW